MLNRMDARYKKSMSTSSHVSSVLKYKPFIDMECKIVETPAGKKNTHCMDGGGTIFATTNKHCIGNNGKIATVKHKGVRPLGKRYTYEQAKVIGISEHEWEYVKQRFKHPFADEVSSQDQSC